MFIRAPVDTCRLSNHIGSRVESYQRESSRTNRPSGRPSTRSGAPGRLLRRAHRRRMGDPVPLRGWRVREVAAHLTLAHTGVGRAVWGILRARGDFNRMINDASVQAAKRPVETYAEDLRAMIGSRRKVAFISQPGAPSSTSWSTVRTWPSRSARTARCRWRPRRRRRTGYGRWASPSKRRRPPRAWNSSPPTATGGWGGPPRRRADRGPAPSAVGARSRPSGMAGVRSSSRTGRSRGWVVASGAPFSLCRA